MNYTRMHWGDWRAAAHVLTLAQEGAYLRLVEWCYVNEKPIPDDKRQIREILGLRVSRAVTFLEILSRFFVLQDGFWHHKRVDEELARYHAGAPARKQRKLDSQIRGARYFVGHKAARDFLAAHGSEGLTRATPMDQLKAIAQKMHLGEQMQRCILDAQANAKNAALTAAYNKRLPDKEQLLNAATAEKENDSNSKTGETKAPHKPLTINKGNAFTTPKNDSNQNGAPAAQAPSPDGSAPAAPCVSNTFEKNQETAAQIARHAKAAGIAFTNKHDDLLRALVADGATLADFEIAVAQAVAIGKGWAYMLGIVRERQADAARMRIKQPEAGLEGVKTNGHVGWVPEAAATPLTPDVTAEIAADPARVRALLAPLRASLAGKR